MKKNGIWIVFLVIIAVFALWFLGKAGYAFFSYTRLTHQVPTVIEDWRVEEIKADQYGVFVKYNFEFKGKNYKANSRIGGYFPNPWAAQKAQEQFAKESWPAWINPKRPEQVVLIKKFPLKKVVSAVILIGLLIYFLFLSNYVKGKNGQ